MSYVTRVLATLLISSEETHRLTLSTDMLLHKCKSVKRLSFYFLIENDPRCVPRTFGLTSFWWLVAARL